MTNTKQNTKHSEHIDFKLFRPARHKRKELRNKPVITEPTPDEMERAVRRSMSHMTAQQMAGRQILELPTGVARRAAIMYWIDNFAFSNEMRVNRAHNFNLNDPDLKWLLKHGLLTRIRYGSRKSRSTYLIRKQNDDEG